MKLVIEFSTDFHNEAFQPDPFAELERVMAECSERLAFAMAVGVAGPLSPLRDINGNTFASVSLEPSELI